MNHKETILSSRGIKSLDLLRFLAAWMVVVPHFFLFSGYKSEAIEFVSVFAVEIFFVLSGFVLGQQLDRCFASPSLQTVKVFYVRRWMRTLPTYFIALTLMAAASGTLLHSGYFDYVFLTKTWLSVPENGEFFLTAWSLAIEEWFYLLFPLFLIGARRLNITKGVAIAAFIVMCVSIKVFYTFQAPDLAHGLRRITVGRLDSIAIGYLAYLFFKTNETFNKKYIPAMWLSACILTSAAYWLHSEKQVFVFAYSAGAAAVFIVLSAALSESKSGYYKFIEKMSAFGAHTSYAAYIYHMLVFQIVTSLPFSIEVVFAIYVASVIIATVASYYLVERPFLVARPSYHANESHSQPKNNSLLIKTVTNVIVCSVLLVACEYGARGLLFFYDKFYVSRQLAHAIAPSPQANTAPTTALEGDNSEQAFARDHAANENMDGSPFKYSSFSVYGNRAFSSETLNISPTGERSVPHPTADTQSAPALRIWVFGASPVFGATNADAWTIPARLAVHLSQSALGRPVEVRNFGVVGYLSWQDLISFQKALMSNPAPDMVILFGTNNDIERSWIAPTEDCSHLMLTGAGSSNVLNSAWENLSRKRYFFSDEWLLSWERNARGLVEIRRLMRKAQLVLENKLHPEEVKAAYVQRRDTYNQNALKCMGQQVEAFGNNVSLMATLARSKGAMFFAGTLPTLSTTHKPLSGNETVEKYTKSTYFFALDDNELAMNPSLPNERLSQEYFADKKAYYASIDTFNDRLAKSLQEQGGVLLDMKKATDQLDSRVQLFSTAIHFTHIGADFIAAETARQLLEAYKAHASGGK